MNRPPDAAEPQDVVNSKSEVGMANRSRNNDYTAQVRSQPNRAPRAKIERAGHGIWLMLHMLSKRYQNTPLEFADIIEETFEDIVPCSICRGESLEHLKQNPIKSDTYPPLWISHYHNKVNLRLGKLVFPLPSPPRRSYHTDSFRAETSRMDFVDTGYYID